MLTLVSHEEYEKASVELRKVRFWCFFTDDLRGKILVTYHEGKEVMRTEEQLCTPPKQYLVDRQFFAELAKAQPRREEAASVLEGAVSAAQLEAIRQAGF